MTGGTAPLAQVTLSSLGLPSHRPLASRAARVPLLFDRSSAGEGGRWGEGADRPRSFECVGTPRALPSRFPKQNSRPRVAVTARPLARARASIQLSLPLPSSPEGRAA